MRHALAALILLVSAAVAVPAVGGEEEWKGFDAQDFLKRLEPMLKVEQKGLWKQVRWQKDLSLAVRAAQATGKPIVVFCWRADGMNPQQACLGARGTRGTAHSDADVIRTLNTHFIPFELDVTKGEFPENMPGLNLVELTYKSSPAFNLGFSTTVVLTPDGKNPVGWSGNSEVPKYDVSIAYDGDRYLWMLEEAAARATRLAKVEQDPSKPEIEKAIARGAALAQTLHVDERFGKWQKATTLEAVGEAGQTLTMEDGRVYEVAPASRAAASKLEAGQRLDVRYWAAAGGGAGGDVLDVRESVLSGERERVWQFSPLDRREVKVAVRLR